MKSIISQIIFVSALILATSTVHAAGKVAVLNLQEAIMKTSKAQSELKSLRKQGEFSRNLSKLESLKKDHDNAVKKLQKDLAIMSTEQKKTEGKKIQEKRADIEHVMRKLQVAEQEVGERIMREFGPKIQNIVKDIVAKENIGLLLDRKAAIHVSPDYDSTSKVTSRLNAGR